MRYYALILTLLITQSAFAVDRDKLAHFGAGWAIGTTCNIGLHQIDSELTPFNRAWFCTLASFGVGAMWEFVNRRESVPDANDVLATGLGGAGAAVFTIVIDF